MRLRPSRIHLFRIPSSSGSSEPFAVSFWTTLYSGMPTTWRKSLRTSKSITTIIARTAHSAVIHRLKWLEAPPNCKQIRKTSVGRLTAEGSISFSQRLEYQFARDRFQRTKIGFILPRIDAPIVNWNIYFFDHRVGFDRGLTSSYSRAG